MKNVAKPAKPGPPRVTLSSATVDAFIERSMERARKIDRGEKLLPRVAIAFEDPSDLVRVLSAERLRLLHAVRAAPSSVTDLAVSLGRDRKAVRRDVSLLASLGLVVTREEQNPGHGRRKIVAPLAAEYQLTATI